MLHRVVVAPCHPRWVLDYLLVSSFWTGSAKALCSQSSLNPDPSQTLCRAGAGQELVEKALFPPFLAEGLQREEGGGAVAWGR